MAAPTPTARGTPAGIPLEDGFSTKITLGTLTTISFWEKTVRPPGMDGGDPIPQTTMHNALYRTFSARALKSLTMVTCTAAYDPTVYTDIIANINFECVITVRFADGSTLCFYGYLQKFEPQDVKEGEQPEAQITLVPTNWDPTNHVEAAPVLTSVAGT